MGWIIKHSKTKKIMEFQDGDVVEVLYNGQWRAGEITHYLTERNKPHYYVSLLGGAAAVANIDDPSLRRGTHANQAARKHYAEQIQELKDKINHKFEKDEIKGLQGKINKLTPRGK